jgi:proline dehydrogenase
MSVMRSILLWASTNKFLERQFRERGIARGAVRRFMPGERLEDVLDASVKMRGQGIGTVITFLGENVKDAAAARAVTDHYLQVLDQIKARDLDTQISVKLTQLGLDLGADEALNNTRKIAERARATGNIVWVDMEGSAYTEVTLDVFRRLRAEFENTGLCLQAYLRRTPADLESLLAIPARIRLVKGAYSEPASISLQGKEEIDRAYATLASRMATAALPPAGTTQVFGTHDGHLIDDLRRAAGTVGSSANIEFHLLYGIRTDEQSHLVLEGAKVRVLISYGTHWYPWFVRRLAEKPSNVWLVFRNLFG